MARKVILPSGAVAYVENILADGTVRDSMEGYVIPYDEAHIPIMKRFFAICDAIESRIAAREAEAELAQENALTENDI